MFNISNRISEFLAVARLYRKNILAVPEDEDWNRANRHTVYRQFVLWLHDQRETDVLFKGIVSGTSKRSFQTHLDLK